MHISKQMARFIFVGAFNNIILYVAYIYITFLGVDHKYAMTLVYIVGVMIGFMLNRKWTFKYDGHINKAFLKYFFLYMWGYIINLGALFLMVDILYYPHQIVQLVVSILLAIMFFLLQRFWVFSKLEVISVQS